MPPIYVLILLICRTFCDRFKKAIIENKQRELVEKKQQQRLKQKEQQQQAPVARRRIDQIGKTSLSKLSYPLADQSL